MSATIFLSSAGFIVYVLFLYPLILAVWARVRPRPPVKRFQPRTVSVLLPVFRGAKWLPGKLRSLAALDYPAHLVEILVLVDGDEDDSADVARAFGDPRVQVIELPRGGKSAALNAGLAAASGEILLMTDVRQELEPGSLERLVACFADEEVGVASGELVIRDGRTREEADVGLYWKYEKFIRSRVGIIGSIPGATGALYAMRRSLARPMPPDTLLDDVFLPLSAYFQGFRIIWEPGAKCFDAPTALGAEFRRKVRTLAGVYQTIGFFPGILIPNHWLWFHFMSHKLGRMLLPYALISLFISSFWLPPWPAALVLTAQAGIYGAALADPILPDRSLLKRISSPARTFVVLMAAATAALAIFFVPAGKLWRPAAQPERAPGVNQPTGSVR